MNANTIKRAALLAAMQLPAPVQRLVARSIPRHVDGQDLDAQTQMSLFLVANSGEAPLDSRTPADARAYYKVASKVFRGTATKRMGHVTDADADGVPVRIYTPIGVGASTPAVVYYHGGGAVIGSVNTHDDLCRWIADRNRCLVISVDYRLAPEHRFPAGIDDAGKAYRWVCTQADALGIDPAHIAVAGDSFGGYLSLHVCLAARDGEDLPMPSCQLLLYPISDFTFSTRSYDLFADNYLLTAAMMRWFFAHYVDDISMATDSRVSPIFGDVSGLPTSLIVTAGFDPLRDDGKRLADKLEAAGVATHYQCHPELIHGFATQVDLIDAATRAMGTAMNALRRAI